MNSVKVLVGLNSGDVKLGQRCSALSVPYKQCRGSKNSPGAPGQYSLSEAIQQTEGEKDDVSPPPQCSNVLAHMLALAAALSQEAAEPS